MRQHYMAAASWIKQNTSGKLSQMPKDSKLCWNIWQSQPVQTCEQKSKRIHRQKRKARRHTVLHTNMPALHFNTNNNCRGDKGYFDTRPPSIQIVYIKRQEGLFILFTIVWGEYWILWLGGHISLRMNVTHIILSLNTGISEWGLSTPRQKSSLNALFLLLWSLFNLIYFKIMWFRQQN